MEEKIAYSRLEKFNEDAFLYYYNIHFRRKTSLNIVFMIFCMIVFCIYIVLDGGIKALIPAVVFWIILMLAAVFSVKRQKNKTIYNFQSTNNQNIDIDFYNNYMNIHLYNESADSTVRVNYEEIKKVLSNELYLIFCTKGQIIALLKKDIICKNLDELIQSIHRSKRKLEDNRDD